MSTVELANALLYGEAKVDVDVDVETPADGGGVSTESSDKG